MNLLFTGKILLVFIATALLLYGFSPVFNSALGLETSLLSEAWKLIALALAGAIISGFAYPLVRGIKKGDVLLASVKRAQNDQATISQDFIPVVALEQGRKGSKIKIVFQNGLRGEGVITDYAGTISPPTLRLTETEGVFKS